MKRTQESGQLGQISKIKINFSQEHVGAVRG